MITTWQPLNQALNLNLIPVTFYLKPLDFQHPTTNQPIQLVWFRLVRVRVEGVYGLRQEGSFRSSAGENFARYRYYSFVLNVYAL